jgi:hypothetical protein
MKDQHNDRTSGVKLKFQAMEFQTSHAPNGMGNNYNRTLILITAVNRNPIAK